MYIFLSTIYMALAALAFRAHPANFATEPVALYGLASVLFLAGTAVTQHARMKIALERFHYGLAALSVVGLAIGLLFWPLWTSEIDLAWQNWHQNHHLASLILNMSPFIGLLVGALYLRKSHNSEEPSTWQSLAISCGLFVVIFALLPRDTPPRTQPIAVQFLVFSPDRAFVRIALSDHPDRLAVYSLKNGKRDVDPAPMSWYGGPIALPATTTTFNWGHVWQSTGKVQLDPSSPETITLANATDFDAPSWTTWSPQAKMLARMVERKVEIFDSHEGKWLFTLKDANNERGTLMKFSEDGSLFIYPVVDNRFRIVKVPSFTRVGAVQMEGPLSAVYLSSRANVILFTNPNETASHTLTSFFLDTFSKKCSTNLPGKSLTFSGDPIHAVVGSFPRVLLANLVDCQIVKTFAHIDNAALSMDGRKLTLIGEKGEFSTMDAFTGQPLWHSQEIVKIRGYVNIFGMPNDALMAVSTNKNVLVVNPRGKKVAEFIVD